MGWIIGKRRRLRILKQRKDFTRFKNEEKFIRNQCGERNYKKSWIR
jgi:hypothetical protein